MVPGNTRLMRSLATAGLAHLAWGGGWVLGLTPINPGSPLGRSSTPAVGGSRLQGLGEVERGSETGGGFARGERGGWGWREGQPDTVSPPLCPWRIPTVLTPSPSTIPPFPATHPASGAAAAARRRSPRAAAPP